MKTLVVYFSRTGTTRRIAGAVAAGLGAALEEIEDGQNRRGILGFLRAGREAMLKKPAKIGEKKNDPGGYSMVIIGTPVWAGNISSPVRAYLEQNKGTFQVVSLFVTTRSTDGNKVLQDMEALAGKKAWARLEVRGADMRSGL